MYRGVSVAFHALIVDDSSAVRAFVRASLEEADFARVQEAETGFEALRLLASNAFDVVIVDVNMPDINGLELLAFMRKSPRQQGACKILISSTQIGGTDSTRGIELGADAFLKKPFEVDEIRTLIRGLLRSAEGVSG
jgi:two-component system chemotaxis response regulator CheY